MSFDKLNEPRLIASIEDTTLFAQQFAEFLVTKIGIGLEVGFEGQLGAGKTTLISLLLKSLGVKGSVTSPTFALAHEYTLPSNAKIEHWDLYRLKTLPQELLELPESNTLRLIEWPSRNIELLNRLDLTVSIVMEGDNSRLLKVASSMF